MSIFRFLIPQAGLIGRKRARRVASERGVYARREGTGETQKGVGAHTTGPAAATQSGSSPPSTSQRAPVAAVKFERALLGILAGPEKRTDGEQVTGPQAALFLSSPRTFAPAGSWANARSRRHRRARLASPRGHPCCRTAAGRSALSSFWRWWVQRQGPRCPEAGPPVKHTGPVLQRALASAARCGGAR